MNENLNIVHPILSKSILCEIHVYQDYNLKPATAQFKSSQTLQFTTKIVLTTAIIYNFDLVKCDRFPWPPAWKNKSEHSRNSHMSLNSLYISWMFLQSEKWSIFKMTNIIIFRNLKTKWQLMIHFFTLLWKWFISVTNTLMYNRQHTYFTCSDSTIT